MTIAISGAGGTAAAAAIQAHAAAPPPSTTSATAAEDKVTISAAAQETPHPTSLQVLALHNEGQSVPQIATQLAIRPTAVQSYLGAQAAAQK
jgi:DNA-binding NarL/FixJ family response regulator